MSYIPTEWFTGDVITAEKLNKIEDGIADVEGGVTTVTQNVSTVSQQVNTLSSSVNQKFTNMNADLTQQYNDLSYLKAIFTISGSQGEEGTDVTKVLIYDPAEGEGHKWIALQDLASSLRNPGN